jgi:hypothetical protein
MSFMLFNFNLVEALGMCQSCDMVIRGELRTLGHDMLIFTDS